MKQFEIIYVCICNILLENNKYIKVPVPVTKDLPQVQISYTWALLQNTEDFVDVVEHF